MWDYYASAMQTVDGMTRGQWGMVFVFVVFWGFICMRGFGSRGSY